jgi:hypothetical protein
MATPKKKKQTTEEQIESLQRQIAKLSGAEEMEVHVHTFKVVDGQVVAVPLKTIRFTPVKSRR